MRAALCALLAVEVLSAAFAAMAHGRAATYTELVRGLPVQEAPHSASGSGAPLYTKTTFDVSRFPLASCLDGGPGAVYVRPASTPAGATKFRIFFQGGGCE